MVNFCSSIAAIKSFPLAAKGRTSNVSFPWFGSFCSWFPLLPFHIKVCIKQKQVMAVRRLANDKRVINTVTFFKAAPKKVPSPLMAVSAVLVD